jgi:hypothetical protein
VRPTGPQATLTALTAARTVQRTGPQATLTALTAARTVQRTGPQATQTVHDRFDEHFAHLAKVLK